MPLQLMPSTPITHEPITDAEQRRRDYPAETDAYQDRVARRYHALAADPQRVARIVMAAAVDQVRAEMAEERGGPSLPHIA